MSRALAWIALGLFGFGQTAFAEEPRVDRAAMTATYSGDPSLFDPLKKAVQNPDDIPIDVEFKDLPNAPPEEERRGQTETMLGEVRGLYVDGSFDECQKRLSDPALIRELLGERRGTLAARVLLWRSSCAFGAGLVDDAKRTAQEFAVYGLELPADVAQVSPEVEAILGAALQAAAKEARAKLDIASTVSGASVSVDARENACVAPCSIDLVPGDHVVRLDADGYQPGFKTVRLVSGGSTVNIALDPATPELASAQWTQRYAGSAAIDSAQSVALLAKALRSERMMLVSADREHNGIRLRSVLVTSGAAEARAERRAGSEDDVQDEGEAMFRELLVKGKVIEEAPPLLEQPIFWISVGVAAAAAITVVAFLALQPSEQSDVYTDIQD